MSFAGREAAAHERPHNFANFTEARVAIGSWIRWYNERRPHQALGYLSPHQYGGQNP